MNTITLIIFSILYTTTIAYLNDNILVNALPNSYPEIIRFLMISSIQFIIYGYLLSIYTSTNKCSKRKHIKSFSYGLQIAFYVCITYLLVYFLDVLREPFVTIFKTKGDFYSKIFFISLTCIIISTVIKYNSSKIICSQNPSEIKKNLSDLDKFLNKKPKKITKNKIKVKD